MKMNFMKTKLLVLAFFSITLASFNANAGWFFESEKSILLKQAERTYEMAVEANEQGRAQDAVVLFSDACGQYSFVLNSYPKYKTDLVTERFNYCKQQIKIIKGLVTSGEITIPEFGNENDTVENNSTPKNTTEEVKEDFINHQTIQKENSIFQPEGGSAVNKTKIDSYDEGAEEISEEQQESTGISISPSNPLANASEKACIRIINSLIDSNKETDAVYFIDELIEAKGEKTPISIRCLYVKALISLGNKSMATIQLDILKKQDPNNPSVRSLIAALAIANGDPMEAMLQLDKLIEENPKYAEARMNYAYLLLMIDPATYRNTAIDSYKLALKLGAKRDMNLEKNLNIILK